MGMSFRVVRNLGLASLLLIFILVSLFSYWTTKRNIDRIHAIVNVEEVKMERWHNLSELLRDSKDRLSGCSYQSWRPACQFISERDARY